MWLLNLQARLEGSLAGTLDPIVRRNMYIELVGAMAYGLFFGASLQFIPVVLRKLGASSDLLALYVTQNYWGSVLVAFSVILMRRRRTMSFAVTTWLIARSIFLVFAFIGFMLMVAGGMYRPLAKRLPETVLLAGGVGLMILGLTAVGAVAWCTQAGAVAGGPLATLFHVAAAVSVAGFAAVNPSVSALISRRTDPERQGEVLGVNQSFASLARIIGPVMGMSLFSLHTSRALPYAAAMLLLLVVAALVPWLTAEPAANRAA
jgi:MFS family permease